MSAIGNYVHYNWSNYLKSGTSRTRRKGYNRFDAWYSQKDDIMNRAEQISNTAFQEGSKELQDLEDALNALMVPMKDAPANIAKIQQKVDKWMYKEFDDALQKIDHETGNVVFKNPEQDHIGVMKKDDMEDIVNRVNRLETELLRQAKEKYIPKDILITVKELKEVYEEAYEKMLSMQQEMGISSGAAFTKVFTKNLKFFREALNEMIIEYAGYPDIWNQKGRLFEKLITYAPKVLDDSADAAIGKIIGDVTGTVGFDIGAFDQYYASHENINGVLMTTHASMGKIDVTMEWQGKQLNISAKNVNLDNYWVRMLSGSSLLYMLQDEDTQFVNHFLNIFATHGKKGMDRTSLTAYRKEMLEEVKLILLYKAITGDTYGRQSANLFILNDNRTGTVKVYSIVGLLNKISKPPIKGIQLNGKTFSASTSLKNTWSKVSAQERISALLADAHAKKVNVSVSTKFFQ